MPYKLKFLLLSCVLILRIAVASEFDENRLKTTLHFIQHDRTGGYTAGISPISLFNPSGYMGSALLIETADNVTQKVAFCAKVLFRSIDGENGKRYWNSENGKVEIELLRGRDYFSTRRAYTSTALSSYPDDPSDTFYIPLGRDPTLTVEAVPVSPSGANIHQEWLEKSYGHFQLTSPVTYKKLFDVIDGMRRNKTASVQKEFPFYYTIAGYSYWYDSINCFGFSLRLADRLENGIFNNNDFLKIYLNHDYAKGFKGYFYARTPLVGISRLERMPFLKGLFSKDVAQRVARLKISTFSGKSKWEDYDEIKRNKELQGSISDFKAKGLSVDLSPALQSGFMN